MRSKAVIVLSFLTLLVAACGEDSGDDGDELDGSMEPAMMGDAGKDGGASDAATGLDSTVAQDASTGTDAALDAAPSDAASTVDTGAGDAAVDAAAGDAAGPATTFTRVHAILRANCVPCHESNFAANNKMASYTALVGANGMGTTATSTPCSTANRKRVVPSSTTDSLIVHKVEGGPNLCGARMPKDNPALAPAVIAEIKSWIAAGALNN